MQTIKIDINKITPEQIDIIVDYLKRGLVIAYPTDTIYGLGCDARDARAVEKIKKIKGGRDEKPFIILISDFIMLKEYCEVSEEQMEYLKKVWGVRKIPLTPFIKGVKSGPTTVIFKGRKNLPEELTRGLNSLAVRLPKSEFLIKMISKAGFPIVSTSLNKTGEPPLDNVRGLEKYFTVLPDLAIDAGECANAKPSKLIDLRDMENIKVIRE